MAKWEIRIERRSEQTHRGESRTVGTYEVFHDGVKATGTIRVDGFDVPLSGTTAESRGPSQNDLRSDEGHPTRIVAKSYPLQTSGGPTYVTDGYRLDETIAAKMPGLELKDTGRRTDILIHPGKEEWRSSVGCINLCTHLDTPGEIINYRGSRRRVIALIEDLKAVLGALPGPDRPIPDALAVIGEAALAREAAASHEAGHAPAAPAEAPDGICWPLRRNIIRGQVRNNAFGMVRNGGTRPHQGWDLLAPIGTECFAIADGKIEDIYESEAYGDVVVLAFPFDNRTLFAAYAHLSAVDVREGQSVAKGQRIGLTGDSGNARSLSRDQMHLHFEIRTEPRPGLGLGGRKDPTDVYGRCPISEAAEFVALGGSPEATTAGGAPSAASPGSSAAAEGKPRELNRKAIFDAVRLLRDRGFAAAEVKALDEACDLALASSAAGRPMHRKPIFDAVRTLLGRAFKPAEVQALDDACDRALGSEQAAAESPASADGAPAAPSGRRLGSLSEVFESGNRGPGTVSTGSNDPGGVSYGVYQLSSRAGTLTAFVAAEGKRWASELGAATPGGKKFSDIWKAIAKREPDAFRDAQHAFIERTHYRRAVAAVLAATGLDLDRCHDGVRDATWSVAVQHGRAAKILRAAVDAAGQAVARTDPGHDRRLAESIYKARTDFVLRVAGNPGLSAGERNQLISITRNRYPKELADCLKMFA